MYDEGGVTKFKYTSISRHTLKTSDGRLVDCFLYEGGYAGGLSCIPIETEEEKPAAEKHAAGNDNHN